MLVSGFAGAYKNIGCDLSANHVELSLDRISYSLSTQQAGHRLQLVSREITLVSDSQAPTKTLDAV
jgi:hypothetical protein